MLIIEDVWKDWRCFPEIKNIVLLEIVYLWSTFFWKFSRELYLNLLWRHFVKDNNLESLPKVTYRKLSFININNFLYVSPFNAWWYTESIILVPKFVIQILKWKDVGGWQFYSLMALFVMKVINISPRKLWGYAITCNRWIKQFTTISLTLNSKDILNDDLMNTN